MCLGPEALATAALVSAVSGSAVSAYGMYQQGQAAKKSAAYNAAIQRNQAIAARQKADFDARRKRSEVETLLARQRSGFAKGGVALEGTPLEVLEATAEAGELDAQAIIYGGEVGATGYESQAELSRLTGEQAAQAGMVGAGSTLLTGAGKAGLAYSKI